MQQFFNVSISERRFRFIGVSALAAARLEVHLLELGLDCRRHFTMPKYIVNDVLWCLQQIPSDENVSAVKVCLIQLDSPTVVKL